MQGTCAYDHPVAAAPSLLNCLLYSQLRTAEQTGMQSHNAERPSLTPLTLMLYHM
jgi:hypothetical protein